jgi:hypothetical protein
MIVTESMIDAALRGEFDHRQRERSLGAMFVPLDRPLVRAMLEAALTAAPAPPSALRDAAARVLDYATLPEMLAGTKGDKMAFGIRIEDLRRLRDALATGQDVAAPAPIRTIRNIVTAKRPRR